MPNSNNFWQLKDRIFSLFTNKGGHILTLNLISVSELPCRTKNMDIVFFRLNCVHYSTDRHSYETTAD